MLFIKIDFLHRHLAFCFAYITSSFFTTHTPYLKILSLKFYIYLLNTPFTIKIFLFPARQRGMLSYAFVLHISPTAVSVSGAAQVA